MAAQFEDGVSAFMTFPQVQNIKAQPFTWAGRVYINSVDATTRILGWMKADGSPAVVIQFVSISGTGAKMQVIRVWNVLTKNVETAADSILADQWQHLVVTDDGSATAANIHVYKNGTEVAYASTQNGAGVEADGDGSLIVGARTNTDPDDLFFRGIVENFGWWDRVLNAAEINALIVGYAPEDVGQPVWAPRFTRATWRDFKSGSVATVSPVSTSVVDYLTPWKPTKRRKRIQVGG